MGPCLRSTVWRVGVCHEDRRWLEAEHCAGDDLLSNRPARGIRGTVTATMAVPTCTVADLTMCSASLLLVSLLVLAR